MRTLRLRGAIGVAVRERSAAVLSSRCADFLAWKKAGNDSRRLTGLAEQMNEKVFLH
jgi:hypothetical protein